MNAPEPSPVDEFVDWIDAEGNVIEVVTRTRMRAERLRHRSVAIIVMSSDGRILIHRRSHRKDLWPGMWDLCAGGVVSAGESYEHAAHRELAEELGISGVELTCVGPATFDDSDVSEVAYIYRITHDGPYHFQDGEIVEARFVTQRELTELLVTTDFVPDSVAMVAPFYVL